jgi:hypothetical protein
VQLEARGRRSNRITFIFTFIGDFIMAAAAQKASKLAVALATAGAEGAGEQTAASSVAGSSNEERSLRKVHHFMKDLVMARGALFVNKLTDEEKAAGMPILSGVLNIGTDKQVGVAAWLEAGKETGTQYYRLSIGNKGESVYYGSLFRVDHEKAGQGAPDYSGKLSDLPVEHENQYGDADWQDAFQFNVTGTRVRGSNGKAYIKIVVASGDVLDSELPL